ncbi:MAG TPA: SMC-Scp complex subunit ScpB [Bacteroidota bacterium]|nr:SMC-Scp complex subunit ScpB [Bacteroidota bacterium]
MEEHNITTVTESLTQAPSPKVLTVPSSVKALIEGLIFAADEPLTIKQIKAIYDNDGLEGEQRSIEQDEIQRIIAELNKEYQSAGKAYRIIQIAGGYQFATLTEYAGWMGKLYREQSRRKLSQSSLETLAIVAYKQPISKPEIESIRGVNCDYVLKTLLEKELVTVVGRAETVGRPLLYGTTREFLKHFGLNDVTDLPRPREIEEILGESQFETERRMLEAQAGLDKMKREEEDFKSRLPHIPKKRPGLDDPVQIIPRKRSRQINVRKHEESPTQEPLKFDLSQQEPEQAVTQPQAEEKTIPSGMPVDSVERAAPDLRDSGQEQAAVASAAVTVEGQEPRPKPESEQALTPQPAVLQALVEGPKPAEVPPQQIESPQQSDKVEQQKTTPPPPAVRVLEEPEQEFMPESPKQVSSRWNVWKQKIQTFIKKLFG